MSDFWSRRKEAVEREAEAEQAAVLAQEAAIQEAAIADVRDEDLLKEHNLPEPEELDSAEAVRAFLNTALPQRLKQRALRQLWKLNPALANLDGLIDYGEDFTDSATVIDDLQTTYQVGKGMLRHIEAMAAKDEGEELADDTVDLDPAEEVEAESPTPVAALDDAPEDEVTLAALPQSSVEPVATVDEAQLGVSHARRRMQFHFEDAS